MIEMKNVCFSYGDREVLKDFNLTVHDGQCVCLKGPSGCGKTTVLRLLLGLIEPDSGEISGAEKPSVVFQEDRLLNGFSLKTSKPKGVKILSSSISFFAFFVAINTFIFIPPQGKYRQQIPLH